MSKSGGGI